MHPFKYRSLNRCLVHAVLLPLLLAGNAGVQCFQNSLNREYLSLNGKWNYIVDPYETGYYDYRYQPRDQKEALGCFFHELQAPVRIRQDRV